MRLLHAETLDFHTFYEPDVPTYATLSHTWGSEDDEVAFQDMQTVIKWRKDGSEPSQEPRHVTTKSGFQKITACCRQAVNDRLQYAWIDTCCIDKSSSAELTEAINSMFGWYRQCDLCYVYLADVSADLAKGPADLGIKQFSNSRWFTRGWTLQELLAPERVIFFTVDWVFFGTKSKEKPISRYTYRELDSVIAQATGIDIEALQFGNLRTSSIATRMSWASRRQTTRVEDTAYCLLGIFDINMPLLYGEGKKAFLRLQEEIMKTSIDTSIFGWENEPVKTSLVPSGKRGSLELAEYSSFLAPSPSYFANAGGIYSRDIPHPAANFTFVRQFSMEQRGLRLNLRLERHGSEKAVTAWFGCVDKHGTELSVWVDQPDSWDHALFIFADAGADSSLFADRETGWETWTSIPQTSSRRSELQLIVRRNGMSSPTAKPNAPSPVERPYDDLTLYVHRQPSRPYSTPEIVYDGFDLWSLPARYRLVEVIDMIHGRGKLVEPGPLQPGPLPVHITASSLLDRFQLKLQHTHSGWWVCAFVRILDHRAIGTNPAAIYLEDPQTTIDRASWPSSRQDMDDSWKEATSTFVLAGEPTTPKLVAEIFPSTKPKSRRYIINVWIEGGDHVAEDTIPLG